MHRGLPSWVGLGLGMSISSELWFGVSVTFGDVHLVVRNTLLRI
jgi:hypothetical protein